MDELEQLRHDILQRKLKQNERRAKAGRPPMWPALLKPKKVAKKRPARAGKPPPPESGDEEDTTLSFDEWKDAGYSVRKGQKFHCTDINGVPQFLRAQVQKTNSSWAKFRKRHS